MPETILVIDDDADTRQSIALTLESKDYLVFFAGGEDVAVIMARRINPALIFLNPAVAGGNGLEICKRIHGTEQLKDVPIIVLSAFEGAKDPHFRSLYGSVDALPAPFTTEDLLARTTDALSSTPPETAEADAVVDAEPPGEQTIKEAAESAGAPRQAEELPLFLSDQPDHGPEKEVPGEHETPSPQERTSIDSVTKTRLPFPLLAGVAVAILCAVGFMFYSKGSMLESKATTATAKSAQPPQKTEQTGPPVVPQPGKADIQKDPSAKPAAAAAQPAVPGALPKSGTAVAPPAASANQAKSKATNAQAGRSKTDPAQAGRAVYSVQIAAFKNNKSALAVAKRYDRKGYEAFVHKSVQGDGKILYRVLIGKFSSRNEAAGWAKKVAAEEKIKTAVFKR